MGEELNEHDFENSCYAQLHHVDETQNNVNQTCNAIDTAQLAEIGPRATARRYWRSNAESNPHAKINTPNPCAKVNTNHPYVNVNATKPPAPVTNNATPKADDTKPKEENKSPTPPPVVDLSIFQSPIPQNVNKVIEIIEHENNNSQVVLESSDEDEVVEVALPPKPTITIESSDEDELSIVKPGSASKPTKQKRAKNGDRAISASPVPSVVSSMSDDFIRSDCIALNISSHQPDNASFDFSLHGPDLVIQDTPSKKKKRKKKNKEAVTSTPIAAEKSANQSEECFATPKSKAKDKKKAKTNTVIQKSVPTPDFDEDSNSNNTQNESELYHTCESIVDLTGNDSFITVDKTGITESIMIANVTGFTESEDYRDDYRKSRDTGNIAKYVSSKVPSILNADLDFDNLKGTERVCKKRRYSLTTLRAEMEKFYNESWGGEDFNHREIQKNMSRDKSLWAIDPKDRMTSYGQRKTSRCGFCNRVGHRDDACVRKPAVCYMCGNSGHYMSRCPSKICVNCGSPNHMYTNICRNCSTWGHITCAECNQNGHPSSHCPDLWRRYHNTIDINMPMEKCSHTKQWSELYCSGCSRRGHLIHTCRITVPFSNLPINTPYVCVYHPIYYSKNQDKQILNKSFSQDSTISSATPTDRGDGKRVSKSPTSHESHYNKKRNMSVGDDAKDDQINKTPNILQNAPLKEVAEDGDKNEESSKSQVDIPEETASGKAPDFIPLGLSNHDNKGHVIQDNEVSDSSEVVTSARIYVTDDVFDKLRTKDNQEWLKTTAKKLDVTVQCCGGAFPFLSIKGKVGDQQSFQYLLRKRKWNDDSEDKTPKTNNDAKDPQVPAAESVMVMTHTNNLPKNRYSLLRHLTKALDSLKEDLGDPKSIHKELIFLQNRHEKLLKQKVINPTILYHSRTNINNMLKKLNTLLLGQAGLANGSSSVNELYAYIEKLSTHRGNNISLGLRNEIGKHFHSIFSSNPRDDYSELLKKYDVSKPAVDSIKTKKINKKKDKNLPKMKKIISIPSQQDKDQNTGQGEKKNSQKSVQMKKLMFYHQRLRKAKPKGPANKKVKEDLIRKVHTFIASMFQKETLSSKALKKARKVQEEAQNFLSANV